MREEDALEAERQALIGLHALPGLGLSRLFALLSLAGSARAAAQDLPAWAQRLEPRWLAAPSAATVAATAEAQGEAAAALGAQVLCLGDREYPPAFAPLEQPPPVLHALGRVELLQESATSPPPRRWISLIGARGCTPYGRAQAQRFGRQLAWGQAVVVSGAARGIDLLGLEAAIEAGGPVVAVLGSGLDCPYPREAIPILERALDGGGLVLSEFPFGTQPRPGNFPRRNRLIAALGEATVVVQATCKSGTMNTVEWALKLNREVFALPGPLDDHACSGTHQLLAEGAQIALSPEHLLATVERTLMAEERGELHPILQALAHRNLKLDELADACQQSQAALRDALLDLELRGLVVRLADGSYHASGPGR